MTVCSTRKVGRRVVCSARLAYGTLGRGIWPGVPLHVNMVSPGSGLDVSWMWTCRINEAPTLRLGALRCVVHSTDRVASARTVANPTRAALLVANNLDRSDLFHLPVRTPGAWTAAAMRRTPLSAGYGAAALSDTSTRTLPAAAPTRRATTAGAGARCRFSGRRAKC